MAQKIKKIKHNTNRNKFARFSRVVFLGTSSAQPIPLKRNVSSLVIQTTTGNLWMVDCGEATQHQLKLSTLRAGKLRNIFITHLHGDHCYGIFGLLHSITMSNLDISLNIYGPKGIKQMIETTLSLSGGLTHYKYNIKEISLPSNINNNNNNNDNNVITAAADQMDIVSIDDQSDTDASMTDNMQHDHDDNDNTFPNNVNLFTTNDIISLGEIEQGITCYACRISHRIECYGYIFIESDNLGKLDAAKAIKLGAKGKQLGDLKNGIDVVLNDGTKILSSDVVGDVISGKKIGIMQDCCDCRSSFEIGKNCDLFIHECTFDEQTKQHAIPRGHSTAKMAAINAVKINAKMLMLTHFSSRFVEIGTLKNDNNDNNIDAKTNNDNDNDDDNADDDMMHVQRLQKEAEEEIAKYNQSKCIVRCAADFMSVSFYKDKIIIDKELALSSSKKIHFQHDLPYLKLVSQ